MKKKLIFLTVLGYFASVFALDIRVISRHREWVQDAQTLPIMLTLAADTLRSQTNPEPLQVIFLIDVSERFSGNVRQEIIMGGQQILRRLSDNDFFGIVTYGEFSRTVMPLSQIGFTGRERINDMLSLISTERGRDALSALNITVNEFSQNQGRRSDGKSLVMTVLGETPEDGSGNSYAVRMAAAMKDLGVRVYTVGYGDSFDEIAAISLAEKTGGRASFVDRDRADLLRNRFERTAARVSTATHTTDIEIEFLAREGMEIRHFQDSVPVQRIHIPKLLVGDTINLFFELRNRPRRNSDIEIDFSYENLAMRSKLSAATSFRVNLARGNSSHFSDGAEEIVKYQLLFNMAQSIDELKIGNRAFRRAYADGFRNLLETRLGEIRNEINTRAIQAFWTEMVALYDVINGGTASNEFIAKTVRYHLHNVQFPE